MKILRRIGRTILYFLLGLVLLLLLAMAAIQVPAVQTWATGKAANYLSEMLGTEVRVGGVDIDLLKTAVLEGIFVADQQGDTLLHANSLRIDIGLLDLFGSEIYINSASLEGAVVNLHRSAQDSFFNYQFIIDAFGSSEPSDPNSTPFTFGIGRLDLENVRFAMRDEGEGRFDLQTAIGCLRVTAKDLDLAQQNIALGKLDLNNSSVSFRQLLADSAATVASADTSQLEFPGVGWTVTADEIRFANNYFELLDDNAPVLENALDYSHLRLHDLHLAIDDLRYADDGILANIISGSVRDEGGFQLDELSAEVQVLPNGILADRLVLRTPFSTLQNDTRLIFNEFNDLTDFFERVRVVSSFGETRLAVHDLLLLVPALRELEPLHFPEGESLQLLGDVALENGRLIVAALSFAAGKNIRLQASGSIAQLTNEPRYDLTVQQLVASAAALRPWLPGVELPAGLQNFGRSTLSGHLEGTLADLTATGLQLSTESSTRFAGNLHMTGLPDVDQTVFDLKINDLATRSDDLQGFAETPLPPELDSLGLVRFAGNFQGTIREFDIAGTFRTGVGGATTDLHLAFNDDYSFATYRGRLGLQDFDLGKLLGDTSQVGPVTLSTQLEGQGLTLDDLDTRMDGQVEKFVFQKYQYDSLQVDGRFVQRVFEGKMAMQDPNLTFDLTGRVNLSDSLPDIDATVQIDTANFKNLNLSADDLGLSGRFEARLEGTSLDDLRGQATLTNIALQSGEQTYFDQKITLEAKQLGGGQRALLFDADFLSARVEGRYNFADLPDLVLGYVNDFFPVEELALPPDSLLTPRPAVADQQFEFEFLFTDLTAISALFLPDLTAVDTTASLRGKFDSAEKQLEMTGIFPNLAYQGNTLDSLLLRVNGNRGRLRSSLALRNLDAGGTFLAPHFDLSTRLGNDTMRFDLSMRDDTLGTEFKWGGRSTEMPQDYLLVFDPELLLGGETWQVAPENELRFSRNSLKVNNLVFQKNAQSIAVNSGVIAPPDDLAPLEVRFENFRLQEITTLLNNPDLRLAGGLDGKFTIKEPRQNLHYNASIQVDSLSLNDQLLGDLTVAAEQLPGQQNIQISTELTGENQVEIAGTYGIESREFDLQAELGKLSMVVLDPFLNTLIRNSEGYIAGSATVQGTPDQPAVNARFTTHNVSTQVVLSGTRYRTGENEVRISESEIDLGSFVVFDEKDQRATLSGRILHSYFEDIRLDLRAQTAGLQILNTTRENNPLYYGRLFASADVRITGTAELPRLDVEATTLDSSLLHVEPLTPELAVVQEDYVIFANPRNYQPDSLNLLEKRVGQGAGGFELNLVLTVTPAAVLNVIIDPMTGDQLFCSGRGNFTIKMNPAGDLSITGAYIIENGKYTFNYEGLVKREFDIRSGSSLSFSGDPYDARFDIKAVYNTRATTYELLTNEANLDDATLSSSKRRTAVEVELNIDGSLLEPEITFDIKLPNTEGGALDNLVLRKLADLREDPNELNKQVFGLLLFNSFIQSEGGAGFANVGENVALKSVSGLITTQLNRFADRFISGVDLELGFDSYRAAGAGSGTVTELQVGLSKRLFSDRLTIRVGGNFNLENSQESAVQQNGYSAIAGDFILEYKLNERGTYLLKVFTKSDYNAILQDAGYKTGIGLMYRKSY